MAIILIADSCKPSVVMSSEVFKDKLPGSVVHVAGTGKECLELLVQVKPDMCVVDFDLPDADGVTLITAMRKLYKGPILLTAFPDNIVKDAVETDLFAFNDAGAWVAKPVKFDDLGTKIEKFFTDKHRLGKRFDIEMETLIIGKGAGRGKRAPKVHGRIKNISIGGAFIEFDEPMRFKGGEEMTVALSFPTLGKMKKTKTTAAKPAAKPRKAPPPKKEQDYDDKIKCTIAWMDKKHTKAGVIFSKLNDIQKKNLEVLLRNSLMVI
jgi:CheY-like chemotaxis protein